MLGQKTKMILYRSLWGVEPTDWTTYFKTLHSIGITGIEASLADIQFDVDGGKKFLQTCRSNDLCYIIGVYTSWQDYEGEPEDVQSVKVHLERLTTELEKVLTLDPLPQHINCHAGSDDMLLSEATQFFQDALKIIDDLLGDRISISFETHRGRILYSPWVALTLIERFPTLKFTLDLSHWIIVTERLIKIEKILPILKNTVHLHLRLGTRQASQVSNPLRMDQGVRDYFEECWRLASNFGAKTGCVEYGPDYQPLGFGGAPEMQLNELIASEARRLSKVLA